MTTVSKDELDPQHILVLYAVNKAEKGVPTKTHYQKMMYLILKALGNDPRSAGYIPDHYGPYSSEVDDWRTALLEYKYLNKNSEERIFINPAVKKDVDKIAFPNQKESMKIESIVDFICSLTWKELLLYIYDEDLKKNEGMTEFSDVVDEIMNDRKKIAIGMAKADKVSLAKGAELADMDVQEFMICVRKGKVHAHA